MRDKLLRVGEARPEGPSCPLLGALVAAHVLPLPRRGLVTAVTARPRAKAPGNDGGNNQRAKARAKTVLVDPNSDGRVSPAIDGRHLDV
jgi:hypothetical protein